MDEREAISCCQFADDEALEAEPELYNCDGCPIIAAVEDLEPSNAEAWALFQRLATRFVVDAALVPEMFRRLTEDYSVDDFDDLTERLALIYDIVMPEKKPT